MIIAQIQFRLDDFKRTHILRQSNLKYYLLMAELVAVFIILHTLFSLLISSINEQLFYAELANELFIEQVEDVNDTIENHFMKLQIRWYHALLAPLKCCHFSKRLNQFNMSKEKIQQQMKLVNMLNTVSSSKALIKSLLDAQQKKLLGYSSEFVIVEEHVEQVADFAEHEDLTLKLLQRAKILNMSLK